MGEFKFVKTEYGMMPVPVKSSRSGPTPHAKLKSQCRVELANWKRRTGIKAKLLPYFVGKVQTRDGEHSYQVGKKGTGDDLIGLLGTCLMVEYKAGDDRQSSGQKEMQVDWEETGNPYVLVRKPTDLTDCLTQIAAQRGYIF